jgi:hypothetical protein
VEPDFIGERVQLKEGRTFPIVWPPVEGANEIDVVQAEVRLRGVADLVDLDKLDAARSHGYLVVNVGGGRRVRSLTLSGLKMIRNGVETAVTGPASLGNHSRLVVLTDSTLSGQLIARYAYPALTGGGFVDDRLPALKFENGVISLPDVVTQQVGIAIVDSAERDPERFQPRSISVTSISGVVVESASNVTLYEGTRVVWSAPELLPNEVAVVDLRVPITGTFRTALARGEPLATTLTLSGDRGVCQIAGPIAQGALVRTFSGVVRVELAGEPTPLPLGVLPVERPTTVQADVSYRFGAIRLLAGATGSPPPADRPLEGIVIGNEPYVHEMPEGAIAGYPLARVGLYGRAPELCELSITPVDLSTGTPRPLGPPGVGKVQPSNRAGFVWVEMPGTTATDTAGLLVRANRGTFLWGIDGGPIVRVAVHDDVAADRTVQIDGVPICKITSTEKQVAVRADFPSTSFANVPPRLDSDLFVTFDIADLTMEYAR